jgi:hypothetical protein
MILLRFIRLVILSAAVWALLGCTEDCDKEYQLCLANIKGDLSSFSYEKTCRYPTMNRGDEKMFCECEDELRACDS